MATQAQVEANQRNAAKSTGPRTPAGKARASRNAITHGVFAGRALLPGEDEAAFNALRDGLYARLRPADVLEAVLADRVVVAAWKLRRVTAAEQVAFTSEFETFRRSYLEGLADPSAYVQYQRMPGQLLTKYAADLQRQMDRALAELRRTQAERAERGAVEIADEDEVSAPPDDRPSQPPNANGENEPNSVEVKPPRERATDTGTRNERNEPNSVVGLNQEEVTQLVGGRNEAKSAPVPAPA